MTVLYVWQVHEAGEWSIIAAEIPGTGLGVVPLVTRRHEIATGPAFQQLAVEHHERTGLPVRLAYYTERAVLAELPLQRGEEG